MEREEKTVFNKHHRSYVVVDRVLCFRHSPFSNDCLSQLHALQRKKKKKTTKREKTKKKSTVRQSIVFKKKRGRKKGTFHAFKKSNRNIIEKRQILRRVLSQSWLTVKTVTEHHVGLQMTMTSMYSTTTARLR